LLCGLLRWLRVSVALQPSIEDGGNAKKRSKNFVLFFSLEKRPCSTPVRIQFPETVVSLALSTLIVLDADFVYLAWSGLL